MRRDLFDCVFNVAKKETRSWTENRGRILCSSNATWKPRIWFLPWIKSQPKIDGAYIVFVKSLYEFFSSHRICIQCTCICLRATLFKQNTANITPRRLKVLNDVGKLEECHLWVNIRLFFGGLPGYQLVSWIVEKCDYGWIVDFVMCIFSRVDDGYTIR